MRTVFRALQRLLVRGRRQESILQQEFAAHDRLYVNFGLFCDAFSPENRVRMQRILAKFAPVVEMEGKELPLMSVG